MRTAIYYFSGTGNSLAVAKDIAGKTGATLIPIASLADQETVAASADNIGIVFPVYYGELPMIIDEFAKKLTNLEQKYIFAVCTFGGAASASLRMLRRILRSRGGKLAAAYGVHMPQNAFYKPREKNPQIYDQWKKKLELIVNNLKTRTEGVYYSNIPLELLLIPVHRWIVGPICKRHFQKQTNLPPETSIEKLVGMMDQSYRTNDACNGCGTCARVCPVRNIEITGNRPVWLHHCENCLACFNWCPNKAIEGGITSNGYFYRHPEIKIAEIMNQKGNDEVGGATKCNKQKRT